jgi:hypothetical protein
MVDGATAVLKRQNIQAAQDSSQEASSGAVKASPNMDASPRERGKVNSPGIKVSTVKMMAQLLNRTPAISPATSCEMLVSLLKESHHVDARVEITNSLLGTLETQTAKPALRSLVLDVLEEHVLPMASQLHERRPTSEAEWQCEDGKMPEVSRTNVLFDTLLHGLTRKRLRPDDHAKLRELVFKALEQSAHHNRRWMSLFVEKHGFGKDVVQELPLVPARFDEVVSAFGQEFSSMPDSFFTMLRDMIMVNICPPAPVIAVTRQVKTDTSLRASNEGQHWLKQYDNAGLSAFNLGINDSLRILSRMPLEQAESEVALQLGGLVIEAAKRCIHGNEPDAVHCLTEKMADMSSTSDEARRSWKARCTPILDEIISVVEQAERQGLTVTHLPDVFRLRLALLKLSTWDDDLRSPEPNELTVRTLAAQISGLVDFLVSRPACPYHTDFEQLKSQLVRTAKSLPSSVHIATALGRLHSSDQAKQVSRQDREALGVKSPLAAYLCIELSAEMLLASLSEHKDASVVASVKTLLEDWTESEDVVVMKMGARVERSLRQRRGWYD